MPARLVHQHNPMRPRRDGLAEFGKEQVHCGGIEPGYHQGHPVSRAGHTAPMIQADWWPTSQPARGIAALPPDIAGPPLLPDPRLVLAPDFKPLGFWMRLRDFRQAGGKLPFLKARWAFSLLCGWRGRVFRCDRSSDHNSLSIPVSL